MLHNQIYIWMAKVRGKLATCQYMGIRMGSENKSLRNSLSVIKFDNKRILTSFHGRRNKDVIE